MPSSVSQTLASQADFGAAQPERLLGSEWERVRLGQHLHDGPIQELIGLSYHLAEHLERQKLAASSPFTDSETPLLDLAEIRHALLSVVENLRGQVTRLDPAGLSEVGLETALQTYLSRLDPADDVSINFRGFEASAALSQPVAIGLFRVAQQALDNIISHAQATEVVCILQVAETEITLEVGDNGRGIRLPLDPAHLQAAQKRGLCSSTVWVEWLGGELTLVSQPGQGTTVRVRLPVV